MTSRSIVNVLLLHLAAAVTLGCEEENSQFVEQIRSIKTITVTEVASGQVRRFSGLVQATNTSSLSFEVGGNVKEVRVKLGSKVKRRQVLAVLDKQTFVLVVQGAEANLSKARADMEEARLEFVRKETLFKTKWVTKSAYDQALAAYESKKSAVRYATSRLNLAKRDLKKTVLKAPFDGEIAKKEINPHVEVRAGQKLFEINAIGALEVATEIPETVIAQMTVGSPVVITFPTEKNLSVKGRVTEVGSAAGKANAFPVKVGLDDFPGSLRSGMTAEVTFTFKVASEFSGYLVPVTAIAPGDESRLGYVFVFEPESSVVNRVRVRAQGARTTSSSSAKE